MIIRNVRSMLEEGRVVESNNWISRRLLLANDGFGFSLHDTTIKKGTVTEMEYRNHLEAVYCIEGNGTVQELPLGKTHVIQAGVMYALDKHDRHVLRAESDMRMICVFRPPLVGPETHDKDGVYPLLQPE